MGVAAVIGLGANVGDRLATMRAAVRELSRVVRVDRTSRVYATVAVGGPAQGDFLNAAAVVVHDGPPHDLLDALLATEAALGRVRAERWGPRVIDLDWLWADGVVIDSSRLTVPHPRLAGRAFAMVPLLELVPNARDPITGERYVAPPGAVRPTADVL